MKDEQFDEYIKSKLREEPVLTFGDNIDETINKAMKKAKKAKFRATRMIAAAIVFLGLGATATVLLQGQQDQPKMSQKNENIQANKEKLSQLAAVDVEREKERLVSEGYLVEAGSDLPEVSGPSSSALKDVRYTSTLKDYIYNSRSTVKGKVLGVKYIIGEHSAYTKAKFLVEESYSGLYKLGDIVTVVRAGAIITHYEMIIKEEIDKKFNIPEAELEQAKQKMVVVDNWGGEMIFPDESMILFIGDRVETDDLNDEAYYVSGPVVKFKGKEILIPDSRMEEGYIFEEFFFTKQLSVFVEKLASIVKEKENYSKEKAIEAAYNFLSEQDRQQITNLENSSVRFSSRGIYYKTPKNVIVVTFMLKNDQPLTVILKEEYQLYKITK